MNNRAALYAQAIRGPIVLIAIGVLFAVHQAGVLPFSRTWPLLIIVVGVMKLIERWNTSRPPSAPPPPFPPPPPGGGPRP
jgi:cell wall-active antibiotic response 4TMS protein YvqF